MIETVMTAIFPVIPLIACVTELLVHTYLGLPLNAAQVKYSKVKLIINSILMGMSALRCKVIFTFT